MGARFLPLGHDGPMGKDWTRLGQAVKRAREDRGMTQVELAAATGLTDSTIQNIESARHGRGFSRMPGSARIISSYFGWTEHSVRDVLAGGEPTADNPPPPTRQEPPPAPPQGRALHDARYREIIDSSLPYEEKERLVRDLVELDLRRDRERLEGREAPPERDAG